jgi:Zn-dependent protease with chaperone function
VKKVGVVLITLLSIPFLTLGLLFLVASGDSGSRLFAALAFLAVGLVILLFGIRRLRRLRAISMSELKASAVEMASRMGGELTVSQLRAEHRIPQKLAQQVMDELTAEGTAAGQPRGERMVYVFTGLVPSIAKKLCAYCGTELPVREALRKCPNCGAQLEITKT